MKPKIGKRWPGMAALVVLSLGMSWPASAGPVIITAKSVPQSLASAGEFGENVYDYAKSGDWNKAAAALASLRQGLKNVRADVAGQSAAKVRLDKNVAALGRAVAAKDRRTTMREANQVTLTVADMSAQYKLDVPVGVTRLDYYGRELEIWAEAQDPKRLQATAHRMRQEWDALRPEIESRNAAEAKKFGALVAQVEAAKTPADYARMATPVLDEVDNLEKLFRK